MAEAVGNKKRQNKTHVCKLEQRVLRIPPIPTRPRESFVGRKCLVSSHHVNGDIQKGLCIVRSRRILFNGSRHSRNVKAFTCIRSLLDSYILKKNQMIVLSSVNMSNYILIHVIILYTVLTYIWKKDYDYTVPTYHYELIMDKIIMHWISEK